MDGLVRGSLRPTAISDHLTIQPNGTKNKGTPPAARPEAPPYPPPETSNRTQPNLLTNADRWIEAKGFTTEQDRGSPIQTRLLDPSRDGVNHHDSPGQREI
jgi:hypothetical protein